MGLSLRLTRLSFSAQTLVSCAAQRRTSTLSPCLEIGHSSPILLAGSPHTRSLGQSWPHWHSDPFPTIPCLSGSHRLTFADYFQGPVFTGFQPAYRSTKHCKTRQKVEERLRVLLLLSHREASPAAAAPRP